MIEIFDRMLQFLKYVLLPFAVARDVRNRPHRVFRLALVLAQRPNPHPKPTAIRAIGTGDANLFLLAFAFPRRLEQAKYRFGHIGIADEHPLHGAHVQRVRRARKREIGRVRIDHVTAGIGDRQSVIGMIGDATHDRIVSSTIGETNNPRGVSEQVEQPDHRQERKQPQDIGLRLRTADGHQCDRRRDDPAGHQQHQHDAAAASRRFVGGHRLS